MFFLIGNLDVENTSVVLHQLSKSLLSIMQLDLTAGYPFLYLIRQFFTSLLQLSRKGPGSPEPPSICQ